MIVTEAVRVAVNRAVRVRVGVELTDALAEPRLGVAEAVRVSFAVRVAVRLREGAAERVNGTVALPEVRD